MLVRTTCSQNGRAPNSPVLTGVHEQRRYASAAQLAVDLSAYPSPSIIVANNGMRQSEGKFRGPTNTPLAKYNMRMASHLDHGRSHAVLSLAKRMKDEGLAPDTTTYNLILSACAKEGLYVEARAVFEDMVALGVQPNRQTFHHMMRVGLPSHVFRSTVAYNSPPKDISPSGAAPLAGAS